LRCRRAKRLLARRDYHFEVIEATNGGLRDLLGCFAAGASPKATAALYLFVDHRPVGCWGRIKALDRSGMLVRLVRHVLAPRSSLGPYALALTHPTA